MSVTISFFLVAAACLICFLQTFSLPKAPSINWIALAWALFFLSLLVTGAVQVHSGAH